MATQVIPQASEILETLRSGGPSARQANTSRWGHGGFNSAPTTTKAKDFLASSLRGAVKGFGMLGEGQVTPLGEKRSRKQADTTLEVLQKIAHKGRTNPEKVIKGMTGKAVATQMNVALNMDPMYQLQKAIGEIGSSFQQFTGKSFDTTSPLSSGFVRFDLLPLVRLIYPVYTPLRNKIPRVPGQGTSHRAKILSSISGALPGGLGTVQRDSIAELPAGGGIGPTNWPNQLPPSGSQTAYDLNIPYRFFGLTESISWLAQFAGQGYDDIYGVASLVLLQEFMLLEERDNIAATSVNLATPAAPTVTARAKGSSESQLTSGGSAYAGTLNVKVSALNYWGETTVFSGAGSATISSGDVADVTISQVAAALAYNLYTSTDGTNYYLMESAVGGAKFTLQGAIPATGTTPPNADTGTGSANDSEGLITQLSGKSVTSGVYPTGAVAGYNNNAVGTTLSTDAVVTALEAMWDGKNGYLADPRELICEGTDAARLAQDVRESTQNYLLSIQQSEMANVTAGVAVAEIQNPITRSSVATMVHPYLPQGNALLMSYTLPQPQNNVSNVVETVMVQDYVTIGWPVIDVTFRQSIFRYGAQAMVYAPQFLGNLQGLQVSDTAPYS